MNASIYTRVSTSSQNSKRQLAELSNFCKEKKWKIKQSEDDIISGAKPYRLRKGFKKILDSIEKNKIDVLVVHEISRLGRDTIDVLKCIQEVNSKNCSVYILNVSLLIKPDRVDPSANLVVAILASMASHERELIQQRILSGLKASQKKSGRPLGNSFTASHYKVKYPVVCKLLEDRYSKSLIQELTDVSYSTIIRIEKKLNGK